MPLSIKLPPHHFEMDAEIRCEGYFFEKMRKKHMVTKAESATAHSNFESGWYSNSRPKHYQPYPINDDLEGLA